MSETKILAWHFSEANKLCRYDHREIEAGKTLTVDGPLALCQKGLHASENIMDALNYAPGPFIWRVQLSGDMVAGSDKIAATERTALWGYDATDVLRKFAREVALEAVEKYWDAKSLGAFPAISIQYLRTGDESIRAAAGDAAWDAAWAAAGDAAGDAAGAAARAAAGAAARAAARAAAGDAAGAAARAAAWDAAWAAAREKLERMIVDGKGESINV